MASRLAAGKPVACAPWPVAFRPIEVPPDAAPSLTVEAPFTATGLTVVMNPGAPPVPEAPPAPDPPALPTPASGGFCWPPDPAPAPPFADVPPVSARPPVAAPPAPEAAAP